MFYYWLHLIYVTLRAGLFKSRVPVDAVIDHTRRIGPFDCEGFRYMSNTKYCFYMDFIRFELMFRSKLYANTVKKGMVPTLGSQKLIYRRPLRIWNRFTLRLHLEGWDDRWAYHRHVFSRKGQVYAIGYTRVAFLKGGKLQNMPGILANCGFQDRMRKAPQKVLDLFENDKQFIQENAEEVQKLG